MDNSCFPKHMRHYDDSKYPLLLKCLRILGAILIAVDIGRLIYFYRSFKMLLLPSIFILIINLIFFIWASSAYFSKGIRSNKGICTLFIAIWGLDWALALFEQFESHGVVDLEWWGILLLIVIDYALNRITFVRSLFIVPIFLISFYYMALFAYYFLRYSHVGLEEFINVIQIILCYYPLILIPLEIVKFIRERTSSESENEQRLI
jgi:hypothetical protein